MREKSLAELQELVRREMDAERELTRSYRGIAHDDYSADYGEPTPRWRFQTWPGKRGDGDYPSSGATWPSPEAVVKHHGIKDFKTKRGRPRKYPNRKAKDAAYYQRKKERLHGKGEG